MIRSSKARANLMGLFMLSVVAWQFCAGYSSAIAAETPSPGDVTVGGRVIDDEGRPVAEAGVWLTDSTVLGRATTDEQGRFEIPVPAAWLKADRLSRQQLGLFAHKPGFQVAALSLSSDVRPQTSEISLALRPASESKVVVLTPDGKPDVGAKVRVTILGVGQFFANFSKTDAEKRSAQQANEPKIKQVPGGYLIGRTYCGLPEELSERFATETDADGVAKFDELAAGEILGVAVQSSAQGTQSLYAQYSWTDADESRRLDVIKLGPTGSITGTLRAEADGADVSGYTLKFATYPVTTEAGAISVRGAAEVKSTRDGNFSVPAIVAGTLTVTISCPAGSVLRPDLNSLAQLIVSPGQPTEIQIPLKRAVRVHGLVRDAVTHKPVSGVSVSLGSSMMQSGEKAETDSAGRYEAMVAPGAILAVPTPTAGYVQPDRNELSQLLKLVVNVPAGVESHELAPINLQPIPSRTIEASVVDAEGKPATGTMVRVLFEDYRLGMFGPEEARGVVNQDGRVSISGIDPNSTVQLQASSDGGQTWLGLLGAANATLEKPGFVVATPISMTGRVVDGTGKPIPNATVRIWRKPWSPHGEMAEPEQVKFQAADQVVTDRDGAFETPRELDRTGEYQAEIAVGDYSLRTPLRFAYTGDLSAESNKGIKSYPLGDIVVQSVEGRVVDRHGKPIAGASVFYSHDGPKSAPVITGRDGRFDLPGTVGANAFVFASHRDFRFGGLRAEGGEIQIELCGINEAPVRSLTTLPPALSEDERKELAAKIIAPALAGAKEDGVKLRVFQTLALVDPGQTLDELEKSPPKDKQMIDAVRGEVAKALFRESPDEAVAIIESMDDPFVRVFSMFPLLDQIPADAADERRGLLNRIVLQVRGLQGAPFRAVGLGLAAEKFLDLGDREQGVALLKEGYEIARKLPNVAFGGYARGAFAEELAQIDLDGALELVKDLSDEYEHARHHGNIAHELAAVDAAAAERVLGMIRPDEQGSHVFRRDHYAQRVCYRMAVVDLARARKIADAIMDPYKRADTYGLMALNLAELNPQQAKQMLSEAFDVLQKEVDAQEPSSMNWHSAGVIGGRLLPVAEAIDPKLVEEYMWRCISFRLPHREDPAEDTWRPELTARLALLVARYDREVARMLLEPQLAQSGPTPLSESAYIAAFLTDPNDAPRLLEKLPAENHYLRAKLAKLVVLSGEDLRYEVHQQINLWHPDREDL